MRTPHNANGILQCQEWLTVPGFGGMLAKPWILFTTHCADASQ